MTEQEHYKRIAQLAWQLWLSGETSFNSFYWQQLFTALAKANEAGVKLVDR